MPDRPISELFAQKRPLRSLEFFPPKDDAGVESLKAAATALRKIPWDFVSVTYGAGGSTRERTAQVSALLKDELGFTVMPHLTCVGHSRSELHALADRIHAGGFRNIMTLRGDPPKGDTIFTPAPDGLRYASELVTLLKQRHADFCLGVAGYPEKHPEAASIESDLDNLKRKLDAGAARAITQMFFDNGDYFRFVDRARRAGITAPIVPGIQPIHSFKQISGFAARCGASIPAWLAERFEGLEEDPETHALVASAVAAEQVLELVDHGVTEFHFYTLNRSNLVLALARLLGVRPD